MNIETNMSSFKFKFERFLRNHHLGFLHLLRLGREKSSFLSNTRSLVWSTIASSVISDSLFRNQLCIWFLPTEPTLHFFFFTNPRRSFDQQVPCFLNMDGKQLDQTNIHSQPYWCLLIHIGESEIIFKFEKNNNKLCLWEVKSHVRILKAIKNVETCTKRYKR